MAPSQRDRMRLIHFTLLCYNLRRRSCLSRIKTSGPQRRAERQHQETRNDEAHSGLPISCTACGEIHPNKKRLQTLTDTHVLLMIWKRSPFLNERSSDVLAS